MYMHMYMCVYVCIYICVCINNFTCVIYVFMCGSLNRFHFRAPRAVPSMEAGLSYCSQNGKHMKGSETPKCWNMDGLNWGYLEELGSRSQTVQS